MRRKRTNLYETRGALHSLKPETLSRTQLSNEFVTGLSFTKASEHFRNTPEGQKVDQCGGGGGGGDIYS